MMKKIFNLLVLVLVVTASCNNNNETASAAVKTLTVGIQKSPSNSLVIIASEKHFFDSSKVKVVVKDFTAGKFALQALLSPANDLQIAVCAETPVVLSSMAGNKVKVISQIVDATNECRVVVKKEAGFDTPEKFFSKSRKIATSFGGSPEWTTYNFIQSKNLDSTKISIISMKPEDQPAALLNGAIDGLCIFDPFARIAEKQLGDRGQTFRSDNLKSYYILCVKEQLLNDSRPELQAFFDGLVKAQEFVKNNPDESKAIIAKYTNIDKGLVDDTWSNYNFGIGIDSAFIQLCKDQSEWAIISGKYPKGTTIPDYTNVVNHDLLKSVDSLQEKQ